VTTISPLDGNYYLCTRSFWNNRQRPEVDQASEHYAALPPSTHFLNGTINGQEVAKLRTAIQGINQSLEEYIQEIQRSRLSAESLDWMASIRSWGVNAELEEGFAQQGRLRLTDYKSTPQQQDEILRCLCMIQMQNEDVLVHLEQGQVSEQDWVAGIDTSVDEPSPRAPLREYLQVPPEKLPISRVEVVAFHFIRAQHCTQCEAVIEIQRVEEHLQHPECLIKRDEVQAVKRGLQKIEFQDGLVARLAGVGNMPVATHYDIWVEPWVLKAIETYRKLDNGETGPYAGLTLQEYLTKMNPDKADVP
jgi:hypothetical protein